MKNPSTFEISCISLLSIAALALTSPGCTKTDALGAAGHDDSGVGQNANEASTASAKPDALNEASTVLQGVFTATGSMTTARESHTATLLPDGKVLMAGGFDGTNVIASAEFYDPAAGTFTVTGSLTVARVGHTATLLPSGKVLIAGGDAGGAYLGAVLASTELYDPVAGTFTATGSMTAAREDHTATLLGNGKVLIAAGEDYSGVLASAELYDPAAGTFTVTGSLTVARVGHTATLLPSGKVLIAGGDGLGTAELYDPDSGTFAATGSMIVARSYHTATLLPSGKVLIAGGGSNFGEIASAELYDPATGTFAATGSMIVARSYHTATLLPNGTVLIAGGWNDDSGGAGETLASAELYQ